MLLISEELPEREYFYSVLVFSMLAISSSADKCYAFGKVVGNKMFLPERFCGGKYSEVWIGSLVHGLSTCFSNRCQHAS